MAAPENPKNELLELAVACNWPAPVFTYVPGDVNPFRCQVTQVVPLNAAPFVATGISCANKKSAEKEAAAVMLAELAGFFAQQVNVRDCSARFALTRPRSSVSGVMQHSRGSNLTCMS